VITHNSDTLKKKKKKIGNEGVKLTSGRATKELRSEHEETFSPLFLFLHGAFSLVLRCRRTSLDAEDTAERRRSYNGSA